MRGLKYGTGAPNTIIEFVAPFAGAWIEILSFVYSLLFSSWSHPSRVRGLKFFFTCQHYPMTTVAPFAGAWIEIVISLIEFVQNWVAPFAGAWIEILPKYILLNSAASRTLRGCVD